MIDQSNTKDQAIHQAAGLIRASHHVVVLTGAGFSTPSGLPDFRSEGSGLWTRYLPMEVASLSTFRYTPEKFFTWFRPLASDMFKALPNPAHLAIARLEQAGYVRAIITQNIDGLHHRAGSRNVLEIHGTLNTLTCARCYRQTPAEAYVEPYLAYGTIPHCPDCNGILKPDVILFEEELPVQTWLKAQEASRSCDLMLVAGTSLEVMPSAGLPMQAKENGAQLIIVNKTRTYLDVRAEIVIHEDVVDIIPKLTAEVFGERAAG